MFLRGLTCSCTLFLLYELRWIRWGNSDLTIVIFRVLSHCGVSWLLTHSYISYRLFIVFCPLDYYQALNMIPVKQWIFLSLKCIWNWILMNKPTGWTQNARSNFKLDIAQAFLCRIISWIFLRIFSRYLQGFASLVYLVLRPFHFLKFPQGETNHRELEVWLEPLYVKRA